MQSVARVRSWRIVLFSLVVLTASVGVACFPRVETTPRMSITVEALDRIDAAIERLAAGRWASWSMEVTGAQLAFQVEVAGASAADVCSGIGEAVRLAGDDIAWSAELTRDGRPLTSCGTLELLAREQRSPRAGAQS